MNGAKEINNKADNPNDEQADRNVAELSHQYNFQFDSDAVDSLLIILKNKMNQISTTINGGFLPQKETNCCICQFKESVQRTLEDGNLEGELQSLEVKVDEALNKSSHRISNDNNSYNYDNIDMSEDEIKEEIKQLELMRSSIVMENEKIYNDNIKMNPNHNKMKFVIPQNRESFFESENKVRKFANELRIRENAMNYEKKEMDKSAATVKHENIVLQAEISQLDELNSRMDDRLSLFNHAQNIMGNKNGGNMMKAAQTARIVKPNKISTGNKSPRTKKFSLTADNVIPPNGPKSAQVSPRNKKLVIIQPPFNEEQVQEKPRISFYIPKEVKFAEGTAQEGPAENHGFVGKIPQETRFPKNIEALVD